MLKRLFPERFDNTYRGYRIALWLLFPLTVLNLGIGCASIFRPDSGAAADGIPLDRFGGGGAETVIATVALLGLAKVLMGLFAVMALARYRAMVPLIYLMMVTDFLAHQAIEAMKPSVSVGGAPGGYVVMTLIAASIVGLALSLIGRGYSRPPAL